MKSIIYFFALVSASVFASDLPNPDITPGDVNQDVTQENVQSTICVRGYSKSLRPPASFTNKLKKAQIRAYGYEDTNPAHYEEDHLVPLSIGGAPRSEKNLWPQPRLTEWSADRKDLLESVLYKKVCAGEMPLRVAQDGMATNWIEMYKRYAPTSDFKSKRVGGTKEVD